MSDSIDWSAFADMINDHQRFMLVSHIRPDCDALGSELGMAGLLEQLGKEVLIVNGQEVPPNLAFIDPDKKLRTIGQDIQVEDLKDVEVIMILDTSAWQQIGPMTEVIKNHPAKRMVLDHHVGEDDLNATLFKNTTAEATGRLVVDAAEALGVPLTAEIAMPVFAAMATDTGWFRFASTTETTYRAAAKLVAAGAVPAAIYASLYEQDTLGRVRLRGLILERFVTEIDGRLAHTYVMADDFTATGALPSDTEDVINAGLGIYGVEAAVIMIEQPTGGFKISFRSRSPQVNCSELASQFGGGGHKAAAGAFIKEPFEVTQSRILDAVRAVMR